MKTICVVGSLNYDLVTGVNTVPAGGETVPASSFDTHKGGKGANQAYALRRLTAPNDAEVAIVGCVGTDSFGKELLDHLKSSGVDTSNVRELGDVRTGTATILVESSGENRIMVYPGANGRVAKQEALAVLEKYQPDYVVLQNEIPLETTLAVLEFAAANPKTLSVLNPSPLPELPITQWPSVGLLCVNESEATALSGVDVASIEKAQEALSVLLQYCEICVITLGGQGVVWQARSGQYKSDVPGYEPANRVEKVIDTTGAGDTFLAALVSRLASATGPLGAHVSFAQTASAIAVTRPGAASSIPTLDEVENRVH